MTNRDRVRWLGGGVAMVIAGAICGALIHGSLGNLLAIGLIGLGMVVIVARVFHEVGLTEDREREREDRDA